MAIEQPSYPVTTSDLVEHVGAYILTIVVDPPSSDASANVANINAAITEAEAIGDQTLINPSAAGAIVELDVGEYVIDSPVLLKSNVTLRGQGTHATVIKRKANTTTELLKIDGDAGSGGFANQWFVKHLRFDGNRANQTVDADAVLLRRGADVSKSPAYITNTPATMGGDHFGLEDVVISNVKGNGLVVGGAGPYAQGYFRNVFIWDATGHGFQMGGVDCAISDIDIGSCGLAALYLDSNNNRVSNAKLYGAGKVNATAWAALHIEGDYNVVTSTECQENYGAGVRLVGSSNRVDVSIQGCTAEGVFMHGGTHNDVRATVSQFNAFLPTSALQFYPNCWANSIDIIARNFSGEPITGSPEEGMAHNDVRIRLGRPDQISNFGIRRWYKPSSLSALAEGASVSQWDDSSGQSAHATQATGANQPTVRHDVAAGQSCVRFTNGTRTYLSIPDMSAFTAGTVFVVVRAARDPGAGTNDGLWKLGTDGETIFPFSDGVIYDNFGTNSRKTTVNPGEPLNKFNIYEVVSASSDWRSYLNGDLLYRTTTNTVAFPSTPTLGLDTGNFLDGDIAEFLFFNVALSKWKRYLVREYLKSAYDL